MESPSFFNLRFNLLEGHPPVRRRCILEFWTRHIYNASQTKYVVSLAAEFPGEIPLIFLTLVWGHDKSIIGGAFILL